MPFCVLNRSMFKEGGYNGPILGFRNYMKQKSLDPYDNAWEIISYLKSDPDLADRLNIDAEQLDDMYSDADDRIYEILDKSVIPHLEEDDIESIVDYMLRINPVEAPTWSQMSYKKMVEPGTWLIHFSDNASWIARQGFKRGIDDMTKLALTTHMSDQEKDLSDGGYNFAFDADSRYADYAARQGKYGSDAVMFRSAGVEAYHYGDEEDQIVFYGPAIDPGQIVLLHNNSGDWCVEMTGRRDCAYIGEFRKVVDWVTINFDQYRKRITSSQMKWQRQTWL